VLGRRLEGAVGQQRSRVASGQREFGQPLQRYKE